MVNNSLDPEYYNNLILLEKEEKKIKDIIQKHEEFRILIARRNTELFVSHLKDKSNPQQ